MTGRTTEEALKTDTTHWFDEAHCGVFFHWGPYSVAARGEWVMNRERIPAEEYEALYIDTWKGEAFDPDGWMQAAQRAAASYVVLTTRHHDGFALWDSRVNPHNSVQKGPKRDIVAEFVAAARRHGLRVGLYYSLANWIHPDYARGFYRDWPGDSDWPSDDARGRFIEYNRAELRELMTNYGPVDYLWFDGHFPESIRSDATNTMVRELQPGILINDRNGPTGDVQTLEQGLSSKRRGTRWEACFTLNGNWGYHSQDAAYKRPEQLFNLLLKVSPEKGKLLLNIGPRGDGSVPTESRELLGVFGDWVRSHDGMLRNCSVNDFAWNNSATVSLAGDSVFLHFSKLPESGFCWAEVEQKLTAACLLPERRPIKFTQDGTRIFLEGLDALPRDRVLPTIELRFETPPKPTTESTTFWIPD